MVDKTDDERDDDDDEYRLRAQRLFKALSDEITTVLVATNSVSVASHDIDFVFRPNSNMLYLCGCTKPYHLLILSRQDYTRRVVRGDDLHEFSSSLPTHTVAISFEKATFDAERDPVQRQIAKFSHEAFPCASIIYDLRLIKSPREIFQIRLACRATSSAMQGVDHVLQDSFATERLIARDIELGFTRNMADGRAFPTIVAFDEHAMELHHEPTHRRPGRRLLVDAGARVGYYSADMSRVWLCGLATEKDKRFLWMLSVVLEAHRAAVQACLPGNTQDDVERIARGVLESQCAVRLNFAERHARCPHYISHWVGLDVHDPGARTAQFETNMVLAVEPGLYIDGTGVRWEDTVRVDDVPEVLTA